MHDPEPASRRRDGVMDLQKPGDPRTTEKVDLPQIDNQLPTLMNHGSRQRPTHLIGTVAIHDPGQNDRRSRSLLGNADIHKSPPPLLSFYTK